MPPEGSSEDDSDQDGGLPEEQEEDRVALPKLSAGCAKPFDMWRSRVEKLPE